MKSHILALEDIFEGVSLFFDDTFITFGDSSTLTLDIDTHESPPSLDLSHSMVQFDHENVMASSSLENPIQFLKASLIFDDNYGTSVLTSFLSLELVQNQFPLVPCLSPSIMIGYAHDWFMASSSTDMETYE